MFEYFDGGERVELKFGVVFEYISKSTNSSIQTMDQI